VQCLHTQLNDVIPSKDFVKSATDCTWTLWDVNGDLRIQTRIVYVDGSWNMAALLTPVKNLRKP